MTPYIDHLKELLASFADVQVRRMFGGYGIFNQGLMFALVADDVLYFKTDKALAKEYARQGLVAFQYQKQQKIVTLSYYQAPEEALEDPEKMQIWAARSFQVALSANANK